MGELISISKKTVTRGRKPVVDFAGIRIALNKGGKLKTGEERYALVFTFYNGIDRIITHGDYIDVAFDKDYPNRLYIIEADSTSGKILSRKNCKRGSIVKTCHYTADSREKWEKWIGSYVPIKEAERDIYYIDIDKKVV